MAADGADGFLKKLVEKYQGAEGAGPAGFERQGRTLFPALGGDKGYVTLVPPSGWTCYVTHSGQEILEEFSVEAPPGVKLRSDIANLRSVVERSIRRVKKYEGLLNKQNSKASGLKQWRRMYLSAVGLANRHILKSISAQAPDVGAN